MENEMGYVQNNMSKFVSSLVDSTDLQVAILGTECGFKKPTPSSVLAKPLCVVSIAQRRFEMKTVSPVKSVRKVTLLSSEVRRMKFHTNSIFFKWSVGIKGRGFAKKRGWLQVDLGS
jgi:hypothetical protein